MLKLITLGMLLAWLLNVSLSGGVTTCFVSVFTDAFSGHVPQNVRILASAGLTACGD